MHYRPLGDWSVSALGLGAMRFPETDGVVDVDAARSLIHRAIDLGVNYIDAAYIYHREKSEEIVGAALHGGRRAKVRIATKLPMHLVDTPEKFDTILHTQLARLRTDHIDYYMFHGIGGAHLEQIRRLDLFSAMERAKRAGKIGHIGFSFHDLADAFLRILDAYDAWDFCQIQYNYMDEENQAGTAGLRAAAARGIPVVVMEPLLGGRLARPPRDVAALFAQAPRPWSPAGWSLAWLWDHPEVATVLSGMGDLDQLEENCAVADAVPGPNSLTDADRAFVEAVRDAFARRAVVNCTACRYCMPCPHGVDIPRNFDLYNQGVMYGNAHAPRFAYGNFVPPEHKADRCTRCGECETACPQSLPIMSLLPRVHDVLSGRMPFPSAQTND